MQASFGPSAVALDAAVAVAGRERATRIDKTAQSTARAWLAEQLAEPPTLLREHYRRRANPRIVHDAFSGGARRPCE